MVRRNSNNDTLENDCLLFFRDENEVKNDVVRHKNKTWRVTKNNIGRYNLLSSIVENGSGISNNEISLPLLVMVRTFLIKASFLAVV